jgi:hypothetical protein
MGEPTPRVGVLPDEGECGAAKISADGGSGSIYLRWSGGRECEEWPMGELIPRVGALPDEGAAKISVDGGSGIIYFRWSGGRECEEWPMGGANSPGRGVAG